MKYDYMVEVSSFLDIASNSPSGSGNHGNHNFVSRAADVKHASHHMYCYGHVIPGC